MGVFKHVTASVMIAAISGGPAAAGEFNGLLKSVFGSDKPADLALPVFIGLFTLTAVSFWIMTWIGRRRQKRMIGDYNAQLAAHSQDLRRGSEGRRKPR